MPNNRIMVVEDEKIVAEDIRTSIEEMGYPVCAMAASGSEAIEKANLTRPDLILMDIVLKGDMDGVEAATKIKELYNIPVVYLTAFGEDGVLQRAKVAEPYGYITKPFSDRDLQIAIEISIYKKQAEVEKAELEAQNRQLQKAESLGRMAGAIAHHFNNQLGVVIGNLEMAINALPQSEEPVSKLTAALQAAAKAAEMSGLMLTYLGQASAKLEYLDLAEVCLRSLPILQTAVPVNVTLETELSSPGTDISGNGNQIQQVLTNLVTNAWEAVGESRGEIHLGVKKVLPADIPAAYRFPRNWQPREAAYAGLEVSDTGCGIADDDIEKLFDPFFSTKFTGRGMGLAVVVGIVRSHKGVVTVESKPGQGSTFRVFFPVSGEEVTRPPDKTAPSLPAEGGGTILLVDDNEMLREVTASMLRHLGFAVLEAEDGVDALEVFQEHQNEIRCVLSDLTMPRMNGWDTLTALRKKAPGIPVILASGYDRAQVMAGDHTEWPQAFLGKPFNLKQLGEAIGQALVGNKQ